MKKGVWVPITVLFIVLTVSLCSCAVKWTERDITQARRVEITVYDRQDPNIQVIYTIDDHEAVEELCQTFANLDLKKTKLKGMTQASYYVRFTGHGRELDHFTVITGHNTIQDRKGNSYLITEEIDVEDYLSKVIATVPSEKTRNPEEHYQVSLCSPAANQVFGKEDAPPVFSWSVLDGLPQAFMIEIDCMGDGSYMSIPAKGLSQTLTAQEWEKIKENAPITNGIQTVKWRIRIDPVYHEDLDPYYTAWSQFDIQHAVD